VLLQSLWCCIQCHRECHRENCMLFTSHPSLSAPQDLLTVSLVDDAQQLAIKQIVVARQANKQVVVNEILLMRMCQHSSIVQFCDAFLVHGTLWVAMEYIEGEDLTQIIAANKMTEPQIAACLRAVCMSSSQPAGGVIVCHSCALLALIDGCRSGAHA
jgi:serine/threonine protein kinase